MFLTAQAAAARAGFGVALLPRYLGAAADGLEPVSLGPEVPAGTLSMLIRPDLTEVPRVRALTDFLVSLFHDHRALFHPGG